MCANTIRNPVNIPFMGVNIISITTYSCDYLKIKIKKDYFLNRTLKTNFPKHPIDWLVYMCYIILYCYNSKPKSGT